MSAIPVITPLQGLRVGTAPVNWNNNDLEGWRPAIPFPEILDRMVEAGYRETEWDQSFGTDIAVLNAERERRGVTFTGAYRWLDFLHDDQFAIDSQAIVPFLETLQGIGARHLIVADAMRPNRVAIAGAVPADGSASLEKTGYERIARNLTLLSDLIAPYQLRLHYHNHVGSYIETPAELDSLRSVLDLNRVDLCFDTGHYAFGGGNALEFLHANIDAIGYLHLKDVDPVVLAEARANGWSFLESLRHYVFCSLGEGNAEIPAILDVLVNSAFSDYVIIEQDTCRDDSTANASRNLEAVMSTARDLQAGRIQP